jgi:glycine dehydrogenase subunit 2
MSEFDVVRHYTRLSRLNYAWTRICILRVCTMKYTRAPTRKSRRWTASRRRTRPRRTPRARHVEVLWRLEKMLCSLTGLAAFTLQPAAGRARRIHRAS